MKIQDKMMKLLEIEPDFQNVKLAYELAMKSNNIDEVKSLLENIKVSTDFAIIRSYVGKFMEQEKVSEKEYEKYLDEFSKNCTACIDEYMKDDPKYQAFLENKKHPKNIIKFTDFRRGNQ